MTTTRPHLSDQRIARAAATHTRLTPAALNVFRAILKDRVPRAAAASDLEWRRVVRLLKREDLIVFTGVGYSSGWGLTDAGLDFAIYLRSVPVDPRASNPHPRSQSPRTRGRNATPTSETVDAIHPATTDPV